ncbi:hypothetical protein [Duncaniella muris]|mgnify:FL=1|uniref:hypothetical protein n=1 Tax=Duncaniella muris TaxID=2094150 RepID=UPI0025A579AF|nr:hypothetical protein [Duncaniella muris]
MDRQEKIKALYASVSKSKVHREYRDRISFMRGWNGQKIAATLKKVCTYHIDHPNTPLGLIYSQAFRLKVNGSIPSVANF